MTLVSFLTSSWDDNWQPSCLTFFVSFPESGVHQTSCFLLFQAFWRPRQTLSFFLLWQQISLEFQVIVFPKCTNKSFVFPRYLTSSWTDSRRLTNPVLMDRLKITWADFTLGVSSLKTEWLVALLFRGCPEQPPYGVPHLQLGRKQHSLAALTQLAG